MLTVALGEEKKAIISMLGKLYINANSNAEKLQSTTELVEDVIDERISSEASSRNAFSKLHVQLKKAMGAAKDMRKTSNDTLAHAAADGLTTADDEKIDGSVSANEGDIKMEENDENVTKANDSLIEDLLDDDDEDISS